MVPIIISVSLLAVQVVHEHVRGQGSPVQAITNLDIGPAPSGPGVQLTWTPRSPQLLWWPAEGGGTNEVQVYDHDVRCSLDPLTEANWSTAIHLPDPVLRNVDTGEARMVTDKPDLYRTYFYGVKWLDVGSWSDLSNVVQYANTPSIDVTPPERVTTLAATSWSGSVRFQWTAPWDNNRTSGITAGCELRYSTLPVTDADWAAATPIPGWPGPFTAGVDQSFQVDTLPSGSDLYFGIKTVDAASNWSAVSNPASVRVEPDLGPPDAVTAFSVMTVTEDSVTLSWSASGDDAQVGRAFAYDLRCTADGGSSFQADGLPAPDDAGLLQEVLVPGLRPDQDYHFAIRVVDERQQWGASVSATARTLKPSGSAGNTRVCGASGGSAVAAILLMTGLVFIRR